MFPFYHSDYHSFIYPFHVIGTKGVQNITASLLWGNVFVVSK